MPIAVEAVRHISLFSALDREDMALVATLMTERTYARGEAILAEGVTGGGLYYVRSGLVKVYKLSAEGKEQVLRLIAPGQTFNEVPALDGGPNPASVTAIEHSVVDVLGRADLHRLILERPAVAESAVISMARALRHLVGLVEDLSFRHVTARVAKILLDRATAPATAEPVHRLTQQEMAAMAGTAREVVGRALKELDAAGAITIRRGHPEVLDAARLRAFG